MVQRSLLLRIPALFALALATLFMTMLGSSARADDLPITFQGEVDSDGPLVISPHADDDPETVTINSSSNLAYIIQRMPQTKSVTSITLGDFGQGTCSSATPTVHLTIVDALNHDLNGASTFMAYTPDIPLPETPGHLTWSSFDYVNGGGSVLLLKAGHTYLFTLSLSGCSSYTQTTWAPAQPKLETPNQTCISGLPFGNGIAAANRQWHDDLTSPSPACVNFLSSWWPSEPDGWLVSVTPGSSAFIAAAQNVSPNSPLAITQPCGETTWAHEGITQNDVVIPEDDENHLDGICSWDNYYPPGQQTRYAWSTALPLRPEFDGAPRLPYVELDTVGWDTLLQQFRPELKYDSRETYFAESVDGSGVPARDAARLRQPGDQPQQAPVGRRRPLHLRRRSGVPRP